jgi:hypothetical protein
MMLNTYVLALILLALVVACQPQISAPIRLYVV